MSTKQFLYVGEHFKGWGHHIRHPVAHSVPNHQSCEAYVDRNLTVYCFQALEHEPIMLHDLKDVKACNMLMWSI